jgi:hypothetical protein
VRIKPTYVNEEIMDKASKVHNELIEAYGPAMKRQVGNAPDQQA